MKLAHSSTVPVPVERVWTVVMDVPRAAACVPGVSGVSGAGEDRFRGDLAVQVGPVRLSFSGEVAIVARDDAAHRATLRADAKEARLGGSVHASVEIALARAGEGCALRIESDLQVAGRIGELGQPLIQRKADQLLREFGACLARTAA